MALKSDIEQQLKALITRGGMPESMRIASALSTIPAALEKGKERAKNAVISGINLLPQLAGLIRDEDDLTNYENMSAELTRKAGRHTETSSYAPFISGVAGNLREDYNMYTNTMESAANLFKTDEYIDTAEGWDNLDDEIAKMKSDDGKTSRYQGNGTNLYLVEQQDKINSLIGRIKNSSKSTQFRYNKAGNEYTDQEVLEKLEKHGRRIAIAVDASYGDGIINRDEAELIMTGNLAGYQGAKDDAIDQIETEIKRLNRLEESISKQISKHVGKKGSIFSSIDMEGIVSDVNTELGSDFTAPDINTLLEDLSERQSLVYDEKVKLKRSYRGWQGKEYLQAPKVSKSDREKYEESILGVAKTGADPLEVQRLIPELGGVGTPGKLPGEIVEGKLIPDIGTVAEKAERRAEAEELAKIEIPELKTPVGDVSNEGITESDWKNTAAKIGGLAVLTQTDKIAEGISMATKGLAKASRYIHSASKLSAPQITEFLETKSVQNTLDNIKSLEAKMASLKKEGKVGTEAYTTAKRKLEQTIKNRSNYWADKFKVDKKHINKLWKTKDRWDIFRFKADLKNKYPKLAKDIFSGKVLPKTVGVTKGVGKLGRAYLPYKVGSIVADALGVEGLKHVGVTVGTGAAVQEATKRFWPKALSMAKTPAGKAALKRIFGKTIGTKIIQGAVVGKHPAIAAILGGAGAVWGAVDMYNAIRDWSE